MSEVWGDDDLLPRTLLCLEDAPGEVHYMPHLFRFEVEIHSGFCHCDSDIRCVPHRDGALSDKYLGVPRRDSHGRGSGRVDHARDFSSGGYEAGKGRMVE